MGMDTKGNHVPVNGLNLYDEVHGAGQPLVLLLMITAFLDAPMPTRP